MSQVISHYDQIALLPGNPIVSVIDFGAVADGSTTGTDNAVAIQAAIDEASSRVTAFGNNLAVAIVYIPPGYYKSGPVTVPSGVRVEGDGARITSVSSGALFTLTGTRSQLSNMLISGGAIVGSSGVNCTSASRLCIVERCNFDQFGGRAVYDEGISNKFTSLFAQNCLKDANSLTDYTGVLETVGTDWFISDCELTASRVTMSTGKFACAMAIRGAAGFARDIMAEISDHGFYLGTGAEFVVMTGCRADLNLGHGFIFAAGSGRIVAPLSLRNGLATTNTYDGFHVPLEANLTSFQVSNPVSYSSGASLHRYGIFDGNYSRSIYNVWSSPKDSGSIGKFFNTNDSMSTFAFGDHPPDILAAGTTPGITGRTSLLASSVSPITVTNLTGGVNGQRILIRGDGNTTLAHNATIENTSGIDLLLASGTWYRYVCINKKWTQLP